jgi:hypothetical protein
MVLTHKEFSKEAERTDRERIHAEQVAIAYKQAFASLFPLLFGASVVLLLFLGSRIESLVSGWFGLVLGTLVWRIVLLRSYRRAPDKHTPQGWEQRFQWMIYASAVVWGSSAWFIFQTSDPMHQFFVLFLLTGIAAVASGTLASLLGTGIVFL